ncbi:MAG: hypothetical protein CM1200mP2_16270 [Planctomycetaceae bacterium]|nr:MAG: hypothetical protein CM1200mP2_16270 [Planctomycetaceae bacterium]
MSRLETLFRESGLVGSGWQVSKAAVVATANLLRVDDGYVIVDLESGIPAMLVPYYLFAGLRIGSLPLFDDNDPQVLLRFLETHRGTLRQHLGDDGFQRLSNDAEKLINIRSSGNRPKLPWGAAACRSSLAASVTPTVVVASTSGNKMG